MRMTSDHLQVTVLEQAAAQLEKCHAMESALFSAALPQGKPSSGAERQKRNLLQPDMPIVLNRSASTVTLTNPRISPKALQSATGFAAYCKATRTGIGMAINKASTEFPGTGRTVALGENVTVSGLEPNTSYSFALALFDANGALVGELGARFNS